MAEGRERKSQKEAGGFRMRLWNPRVWTGMTMSAWFGLLARHRFMAAPSRWSMVLLLSPVSVFNSSMALLQKLVYGRRIKDTEIRHDPLFIIGHWRSGTTLLHELMVLDPQHTSPDTYHCFAPNHFLVSRRLIAWWLRLLMPPRRPMDAMQIAWEHPQEDEFALCTMGVPSPYLQFAFFGERHRYERYLDMEDVPAGTVARWKKAFVRFLKCVTLVEPKRVILKSPPHTCRIKILLELFPNARFVHIVRDPFEVFPSTVKAWTRLSEDQYIGAPRFDGLEDYVLDTFQHMYEVFESTRDLIDPSRFCEVRYEDLAKDPIGQVRTIYDHFGLDDFDKVLPKLQDYAAKKAGYRSDQYQLSADIRERINQQWHLFIQKYGYGPPTDDIS